MKSELLTIYNDELAKIKKEAHNFSKRHPRVAASLSLRQNAIHDPMISHLIESFSFTSARIKQQLNDEHKLFCQTLLQELYPSAIRPRPSKSIIEFQPSEGNQATVTIPQHCLLSGKDNHEHCRYQTSCDTIILPLSITNIQLNRWIESPQYKFGSKTPKSCLQIKFKLNQSINPNQFTTNSYRLYLNLDTQFIAEMYEILVNQFTYATFTQNQQTQIVNQSQIKACGIIPTTSNQAQHIDKSNRLHLLSQYFHFPNQFYFVDFIMEQPFIHESDEFSFEFYFNRHSSAVEPHITNRSLLLNCTPIVNLFTITAEPIQVIKGQYEYAVKINPYVSANNYGIHQIKQVSIIMENGETKVISQYLNNTRENEDTDIYWTNRWEEFSDGTDGREEECILTLLDDNGEVGRISGATILVEVTATNHNTPQSMASQQDPLQFWEDDYSSFCSPQLLYAFTPVKPLLNGHQQTWNLINHLKIDQAPIGNNNDTMGWLNSLLQLYKEEDNYSENIIHCIDSITTEKAIKSHQDYNGIGYLHGTIIRIKITPDTTDYENIYLFVSILADYFSKNSMINSFTDTRLVNSDNNTLATWCSTRGNKALL